MKIETKYDIGHKVYVVWPEDEFKPEQIEICGVQACVNFDGIIGQSVVYRDQYGRFISENRCYSHPNDLVEHFKKNIKHL